MVDVRIDDEELELSWEEWEARVRAGRVPREALVRFEPVTGEGWVPAGELEMYTSLADDGTLAWRGRFAASPPPIVTALLVGIQIRIWWLGNIPGVRSRTSVYLTKWTPPQLEDGEEWRVFTMGLYHENLSHLFMNMAWLAVTGWAIERALGRANLAVIYAASVFGGSVLATVLSPETRSMGASGGVFGLVAATVIFGFVRADTLPDRARRWFGFALLPYLILMFVSGLGNEGTDNWSHLGGLLTGAVLAVLLDPPEVQRGRDWNLKVYVAVAAIVAAVLGAMTARGPSLLPLVTSERAIAWENDRPPPPEDEDRPLRWSVPVAWHSEVGVGGDPGFGSPGRFVDASRHRFWSVREHSGRAPQSAEERARAFVTEVERLQGEATFGPLEPDTVAGLPGWRMRGEAGTPRPTVYEWRAVVRGLHALVEVWEVDAASAERLAPLRDRLRASVQWTGPTRLTEARAQIVRTPGSLRAQRELAQALAEVGEVDEALQILDGLLADPEPPEEAWTILLTLITWYPDRVPEALVRIDRALATAGTRRIVAALPALEALGEDRLARALLEAAWLRYPGERYLVSARRSRGEPTRLVDDAPAELTWLGPPPDALRTWRDAPLDLDLARQVDAWWGTRREQLTAEALAALEADQAAAFAPLMALALGAPDEDPEVVADLARALASSAPPPLPAEILAELPNRSVLLTRLVGVTGSHDEETGDAGN